MDLLSLLFLFKKFEKYFMDTLVHSRFEFDKQS